MKTILAADWMVAEEAVFAAEVAEAGLVAGLAEVAEVAGLLKRLRWLGLVRRLRWLRWLWRVRGGRGTNICDSPQLSLMVLSHTIIILYPLLTRSPINNWASPFLIFSTSLIIISALCMHKKINKIKKHCCL